MRRYIARLKITDEQFKMSTGAIAESVFQQWFSNNFSEEVLHKQKADRDYQGIDFADEKGLTYQVKGSRGRTFTFNCSLENIPRHLRAKKYVFIQIKDKYAYIEIIRDTEEVLKDIKPSFQYKESCFVWAKDLQQYELEF